MAEDRVIDTANGITTLDGTHVTSTETSPDAWTSMWTIFEKPEDYPNNWVVRRGEILPLDPGQHEPRYRQTGDMSLHDSLESARAAIPAGKNNLGRMPGDVTSMVETWV